jgi:hypothetical protein
MNNTFELKKGKLVFDADKIVITDNAGSQRRLILYLLGFSVILGIVSVMGYFAKGVPSDTWVGFFTGTTLFLVIALSSYRSVQSEIFMYEVKSIKVRRNFLNEYLEIKFKNNISRMVAGIIDAEGLRDYIETIELPK